MWELLRISKCQNMGTKFNEQKFKLMFDSAFFISIIGIRQYVTHFLEMYYIIAKNYLGGLKMNEEMELSEHSPEQLVALIQQGHSMHFEELFYRFLPLVKKFNRAYYLKSLEQDDFWQEGKKKKKKKKKKQQQQKKQIKKKKQKPKTTYHQTHAGTLIKKKKTKQTRLTTKKPTES
eukprot:TRINITY_DN58045_c0_g1_i2.p1 TRINITY_DN58045_c0_g1~~TRINITY_DN58045_c0_g1_i2.p1  ORF type:complete len:176 (-),score=29.59 TRINITY_DN58045_c0_g1_i2:14-541(-)